MILLNSFCPNPFIPNYPTNILATSVKPWTLWNNSTATR